MKRPGRVFLVDVERSEAPRPSRFLTRCSRESAFGAGRDGSPSGCIQAPRGAVPSASETACATPGSALPPLRTAQQEAAFGSLATRLFCEVRLEAHLRGRAKFPRSRISPRPYRASGDLAGCRGCRPPRLLSSQHPARLGPRQVRRCVGTRLRQQDVRATSYCQMLCMS